MEYVIWSNEHNAWWGANHMGYYQSVENAGSYTLEEALKICNQANYGWNTDRLKSIPNELPIPKHAALQLVYNRKKPTTSSEG